MTSKVQQTAPQSRSLTSHENDVEYIENVFLKGSFRDALALANRYLHRFSPPVVDSANDCRGVTFPLVPNDTVRIIRFHLPLELNRSLDGFHWIGFHGKESDVVDRVAAVALQSWYELSKLHKIQTNRDSGRSFTTLTGYRHLQPFLDVYLSNTQRSMSLELLVMWIQFCRSALQNVDVSVSMTLQTLQYIRSIPEQTQEDEICILRGKHVIGELIVLLFTDLLPNYYSKTDEVEQLFKCLTSTVGQLDVWTCVAVTPHSSAHSKTKIYPCKDVIQQCLRFCNTDDGHWPDWIQESFEECRQILQDTLFDRYNRTSVAAQDETTTSSTSTNIISNGINSTDDLVDHLVDESLVEPQQHRIVSSEQNSLLFCIQKTWKRAYLKLVHWVYRDSMMIRSISGGQLIRKRQRIQVVLVLVLCMLYGLRRYRRRIMLLGKDAIVAIIWQPVLEVLEAVGIIPNKRRTQHIQLIQQES